jgi:prefoldin subunit 5
MADEPDNFVVYLRRIDETVSGLRGDVQELKVRQNDTHTAVLAVRRDQGQDAEIVAHLQAQVDRLREEIDRIKRRLELHDA